MAICRSGRHAPWTMKAAQAVQRAWHTWSGRTLAIVDDQIVTSEETWLLSDPYRQTP